MAGIGGFRLFARQVQAALTTIDADFFTGRTVLAEQTCEGGEQSGPCAGATPGTSVFGIPVRSWSTETETVLSQQDYRQELDRFFRIGDFRLSDDYGIGLRALYALAQKGDTFYTIVTAIDKPSGQEQRRVVRAFSFQFQDGLWRHSGDITDLPLEWLSEDCSGCYDHWERWLLGLN